MHEHQNAGAAPAFTPGSISAKVPHGPNAIKNLKASGIQPVPGMPFVIGSAASPQFTENIAQVTAGHPWTGQIVNLGFMGNAIGNMAIWQLTPQGRIVSPYYPNLVIGMNGNNQTCLVAWDDTDHTQFWQFSPASTGTGGFTIASASDPANLVWLAPAPQYYAYDGGQDTYSGFITLGPAGQDGYADEWVFLPPFGNPPNSFYIATALNGQPGGADNPYVVSSVSGNENIYALQWEPGQPNQLFSFKPDGSITQAADVFNYSRQVLTASGSDTAVTWASVQGNPAPAAQSWKLVDAMLEVNNGAWSLNVDASKTGLANPLLSYDVQNGKANSQWYIVPEQSVAIDVWFYLITLSSQVNDGNTYVLTAVSPAAGGLVVIDQLQPGSLSQLWKMTTGGNLINGANQALLLSAAPDSPPGTSSAGMQRSFSKLVHASKRNAGHRFGWKRAVYQPRHKSQSAAGRSGFNGSVWRGQRPMGGDGLPA